jgi:glycerol-3-phosphate acyltransferase PlsY
MIQNPWILFLVLPLAAYVIGATPFGVLLARAKGVDLRKSGSGNTGATNVGRVLGRRWGYACFVLDVAKGLLPVLAVGAMLRPAQAPGAAAAYPEIASQAAWLLVACGAICGHVFSFYLGFRGGKGVATGLGVVLGIWPYFTVPGLAALAIWVAVTLATRYVSAGSIVAAAAFVPLVAGYCMIRHWPPAELWPLLLFASAMVILIIVRHRTNISRLLHGAENKIGGGPKDKETPHA